MQALEKNIQYSQDRSRAVGNFILFEKRSVFPWESRHLYVCPVGLGSRGKILKRILRPGSKICVINIRGRFGGLVREQNVLKTHRLVGIRGGRILCGTPTCRRWRRSRPCASVTRTTVLSRGGKLSCRLRLLLVVAAARTGINHAVAHGLKSFLHGGR